MEIRITGMPFATAKMDVERFKDKMAETWELKSAIRYSVLVTENKSEMTEDKIVDMLIYLFDWAGVLRNSQFAERKEIAFSFFPIEYNNWIKYVPGEVHDCGALFKIDEMSSNGHDVAVLNDFIPSSYYMIKSFISASQFMYDEKEFKIVITEKDL